MLNVFEVLIVGDNGLARIQVGHDSMRLVGSVPHRELPLVKQSFESLQHRRDLNRRVQQLPKCQLGGFPRLVSREVVLAEGIDLLQRVQRNEPLKLSSIELLEQFDYRRVPQRLSLFAKQLYIDDAGIKIGPFHEATPCESASQDYLTLRQ